MNISIDSSTIPTDIAKINNNPAILAFSFLCEFTLQSTANPTPVPAQSPAITAPKDIAPFK